MEAETPIKITPTLPPLSHDRPTKSRFSGDRKFSFRWLAAAVALGTAGIFVFVFLPEVVRERTADVRASRESKREVSVSVGESEDSE